MYKFVMDEWTIIATLDDPYKAPEQSVKRLLGKVYGHPKFKDSTLVITAPIEIIENDFVKTSSGSVYTLGEPDKKFNKHQKKIIRKNKWKKIICWIFGHKYPTDAQSATHHLCSRCGKNAIELN